ncbi:methyltransferase-like protein 22 isoform X1 [Penaeus monodon]|uniref:methyltransferase-like protein 22 isoform X1 n=2 Tax=Penaeus monodon TaxID=6687 RepID=UPI0018A6D873|nr:methyltransferase-like protein 22 isoform X1 [Penaeus monodon]
MASENSERLTVTSEIFGYFKKEAIDGSPGAVLSRYEFVYPAYMTSGEDNKKMKAQGRPVTKKNSHIKKEGVLLIEQQSATTLDLVGEQVWRGALLLADFIFHHPEIFKNANILELASGVGLTSIVASMTAKKVLVTDVDRGDIFSLIDRNFKRNKALVKAETLVKEIDFDNHATIDENSESLKDISIILAADIIYHNQLTDLFFKTVLRLMSEPPNKILYVAQEKRYVFSFAFCYEYFLDRIEWLRSQNSSTINWTIEEVPIDFKQYFVYEKSQNLVLWKISAQLK